MMERIRKNNSIRHKYCEGGFMGIPHIADLGVGEIEDYERGD